MYRRATLASLLVIVCSAVAVPSLANIPEINQDPGCMDPLWDPFCERPLGSDPGGTDLEGGGTEEESLPGCESCVYFPPDGEIPGMYSCLPSVTGGGTCSASGSSCYYYGPCNSF